MATNNDKTIFQVPMTKVLKKRGEKKAEKDGFSSLQEVARVFLNGYVNGVYNVYIDSRDTLSEKAAIGYKKMVEEHETDRKKGEVRSYSPEESIKELS